jgi:GTP diphosphokinase / guanosine-3',5'-bis(diphosphate) 3'-diphosphatase
VAEDGKYTLQKKFEGMNATYSPHNIEVVTNFYKLQSSLDLFYRIATRSLDLKELKDFHVTPEHKLEPPKPVKTEPEKEHDLSKVIPKKDTELIIFGESSDRIVYTLANCCKPIPGDDVFGFVSTGKGLIIHRTNCPNATRLLSQFGHRVVKTKWAKNKEISFLTGINIVGMDDVGVINKITNLISGELKINIAALTIEAKEGLFRGNIKLYVHDKDELEKLFDRLMQLPGIHSVERFDTESV